MSKIRTQGIANSFWTYLGILAGGIYTILIIPKAFSEHPEYWGLVQFLVYYMQIFLPFAQLGLQNTIIRFNSKVPVNQKSDFFGFSLVLSIFATIIVAGLYVKFGLSFASDNNRTLLTEHYLWLIPLLAGTALFESLSAISKSVLRTKIPVFLKDSLPKLWTLVIITAYWIKPFDLSLFLLLYSAIYLIQLLVILSYIFIRLKVRFSLNLAFFSSNLARSIYPFMAFSLMMSSTALWSAKIDVLMIGYLIDLQHVAFYSIALYLATLTAIPFKSVSIIAAPMIADFWTGNKLAEINTILKKVSEVSFAVGGFILLLIWFNIEWIMAVLGPQFGKIKWVFLLIGLTRLSDALFSINSHVIINSKYYKVDFYMQLGLVASSVGLNYWLIPKMGLEGAAISTLIAIFIYNLAKWVFLRVRFSFTPFTKHTTIALLLIGLLGIIGHFNPLVDFYWINAVLSTLFLAGVFLIAVKWMSLSPEVRSYLDNFKLLNGHRK